MIRHALIVVQSTNLGWRCRTPKPVCGKDVTQPENCPQLLLKDSNANQVQRPPSWLGDRSAFQSGDEPATEIPVGQHGQTRLSGYCCSAWFARSKPQDSHPQSNRQSEIETSQLVLGTSSPSTTALTEQSPPNHSLIPSRRLPPVEAGLTSPPHVLPRNLSSAQREFKTVW